MREPLLAYALGGFHALLILLAFLAALTAGGGTGILTTFGTWGGIGLGLWLAILSWGATAWALRAADLEKVEVREILGRAGLAGFGAGAAFVVGFVLALTVPTGQFEAGTFLFLAFGGFFAGGAGSLVGLALAGLDVGLYALARRFTASSA